MLGSQKQRPMPCELSLILEKKMDIQCDQCHLRALAEPLGEIANSAGETEEDSKV